MASDHGQGSGPGPIDDAIFRPNQKPRKNHPTNSAGSDSAGSNSTDSAGPLDDEPTAVEMTLRPEELTAIEASTTWSVPAMTTTSPTINQPLSLIHI